MDRNAMSKIVMELPDVIKTSEINVLDFTIESNNAKRVRDLIELEAKDAAKSGKNETERKVLFENYLKEKKEYADLTKKIDNLDHDRAKAEIEVKHSMNLLRAFEIISRLEKD